MIRLPLLSASVLSVIWAGVGAYPSLTAPPEIAALCPNPPGKYPLLLSNPADCRSFYMCSWDNMAFLQHCPPVLYFNPSLQVCDSPVNVHCNISTTALPIAPNTTVAEKTTSPVPVSNSTSLEHPRPPVSLESVTAPPSVAALCPNPPQEFPLLLANPIDCGSFFMCSWNGVAYLQHCPANLHFNPELQVCDFPSSFRCTVSTTPPPFTNSSTSAPVTNSSTSAPEIKTTAAPVTNSSTSAPEIKTTAAPVTNSSTSAPEIKTTAAPVTNSSTSAPEIKTTAAPVTNSSTPAPEIKTTAAPVTNSSTSAPEIKTTAAPVTNSSTSAPEIKTTAAPVTNSSTSAPEIKTTAAPVMNSSTPAPEIKTTAAPVTNSSSAAPEIKTTAAPVTPVANSSTSAPEIQTTAAHATSNSSRAPEFETTSSTGVNTSDMMIATTVSPPSNSTVTEEPLSSTEMAATCPNPPGEHPVLLPNPRDCGSFFMCGWDGVANLLQCPGDLHFNPELQVCDFPSSFACKFSTTINATDTRTPDSAV